MTQRFLLWHTQRGMLRRPMSTTETTDTVTFTPRIKLTLFRGTLPATDSLQLSDDQIDFKMLQSYGVSVANIRVAGLTPMRLKNMGCESALELRAIGFDALDLVSPSFCASAVSAFGAAELKQAFLLSPGDAVCIAGSTAQHQLDMSSKALVAATAGFPTHAQSVIQQLQPRGASLFGCDGRAILDTGLRAKQLTALGYHVSALREQTGASADEVSKLGF